MAPDDNIIASRQPRYMRVANVLTREIRSGRFPIGSFLPTEAQLGKRFEVSRITVREALRRLEEMGLIVKVHGIGSRVEAQELRDSYTVSVEAAAEMMQYGYATRFLAESRVALAAGHTELLAFDMHCDALKLAGVRVDAEGQKSPLSYSEIYLNSAYSTVVDDPEDVPEPFYRKIVRLFGQRISGIGQEVSAISMAPHQARGLGQPDGAPGLLIIRHFYGLDRELLEVTVNVHPAENFSLRLFLNKNEG